MIEVDTIDSGGVAAVIRATGVTSSTVRFARSGGLLKATVDERSRRLWAGAEVDGIGDGGVAAVTRATGVTISTVRKRRDEARAGATADLVKTRASA